MDYTGLLSVYFKENPVHFEISLKSIYNQTIKPRKVVLVEDGPLPNCLKDVITKYHRKFVSNNINFVILQNKKNMGLGYSLNRGIKYCDTDLVARFDSDDISCPDRMAVTLKVFEREKKISVVGGYIEEFQSETGVNLKKRTVPTNQEKIVKGARFKNPMNHMTVTFKREDVVSVGGYEDVLFYEDYYLWMKLLNAGYTLHNIPEVLVFARINNDFISRRSGIAFLRYEVSFQCKLVKNNLINPSVALRNIIVRGGFRILPRRFIKRIYRLIRK